MIKFENNTIVNRQNICCQLLQIKLVIYKVSITISALESSQK